ncbi:MAG: hypothetical protein EB150_09180 [Nitrososphaeria archaeon]|nr:hypothetical protein [Nitrososphaeria archaeon]
MRLFFLLLAFVLVVGLFFASLTIPKTVQLPAPTENGVARFPSMQVKNLADETRAFPGEFPAEKTLLLIGFESEQQEILDAWATQMNLSEPGAPAWLELPVIDNPGAFMRWFVDVGMKSGIKDITTRSKVFTVYTPRKDFIQALGLPSTNQVHVVVVERSGHVLLTVSGEWTKAKERLLLEALK